MPTERRSHCRDSGPMIAVTAHVARAFRLDASASAAWALLRDVPRWGVLFPHVEAVEPLPGEAGAFVWRMSPLGPPGGRVGVVYACRYAADEAARTLVWTPVEGVGNARFEGAAALVEGADGGTSGTLRLDATLHIPAPSFLRGLVEAGVTTEMGRMTDTFLGRLDVATGV